MTKKRWTKDEDKYLREHINLMSFQQIGDHLGRTQGSISLRVHKLQIKRSEEGKKWVNRKNSGRFKKGHKPWNTGKNIEVKGRMAETQFKKGNLPANTLHDGAITIRKDSRGRQYKYIRLAKGKWELLHRENWRRKFGEIPEGHVIFIKGDPLEVELGKMDNLELITRSENLKRNQPKDRTQVHQKIERSRKINDLLRESAKIKQEVQPKQLEKLAGQIIQLKRDMDALKKAKELKEAHEAAKKQARETDIKAAFQKEGLTIRGVMKYVNAYINNGERKIPWIINLQKERIQQDAAKKKAQRKLKALKKAKTEKKSAPNTPRIFFQYNPNLPGTRQDQLLAWQREQFGQVKYIPKKFHLVKSSV